MLVSDADVTHFPESLPINKQTTYLKVISTNTKLSLHIAFIQLPLYIISINLVNIKSDNEDSQVQKCIPFWILAFHVS